MILQILKLKSTDRIRESNKRKPPTQMEYPFDAHGDVLPVARLYPTQDQQPDFGKFCNGLRAMRWPHQLRRPSWRDGSVNSHIYESTCDDLEMRLRTARDRSESRKRKIQRRKRLNQECRYPRKPVYEVRLERNAEPCGGGSVLLSLGVKVSIYDDVSFNTCFKICLMQSERRKTNASVRRMSFFLKRLDLRTHCRRYLQGFELSYFL